MKIIDYNEPAFLTPWSLVHFCVGVVWATVFKDWVPLLILATAYEIKDMYFEKKYTVSFANSVGDVLVTILGYWLYLKYGFPMLYTVPLTIVFLFSPLSSNGGRSWTTDIWNSRG